jgi:hypothetical protein
VSPSASKHGEGSGRATPGRAVSRTDGGHAGGVLASSLTTISCVRGSVAPATFSACHVKLSSPV